MTFEEKFKAKVIQQIHGREVGFLLGAGASYLSGAGYPLANALWNEVRDLLHPEDRQLIEGQIIQGGVGLEEALDILDNGSVPRQQLRHRVASAIANRFRTSRPPLEFHCSFIRGITRRPDRRVRVFSLNYDPLVENAADCESLLLSDGFCGANNPFFHPVSFEFHILIPSRRRQRPMCEPIRGIVNLYKLHGSIGWFIDERNLIRRCTPEDSIPDGATLLMIPPHYRKAQDTGIPPYSLLWSEFRGMLNNDQSRLLSRFVCVGYGLGDTHVNPILETALANPNFTMLILARDLPEARFDNWKRFENVVIATEHRSALYREEGPGLPEIWSFEWLAEEVNRNA